MTDRARNRGAKTLSISVIVGILLVPVSAAAAFWLVDPGGEDDDSATAIEGTTTTLSSPEATDVVPVALFGEGLERGDIEEACGPAGMQLVALEEEGSITDLQQAALDALRDICEQEEMPLPPAPQPDPIVQTVVVTETATSPATTAPDVEDGYDDGYDDDRYEDDEHEDHEDEDHDDEDHDDEDRDDD